MKRIAKPIATLSMILFIGVSVYAGNLEPPAGDPAPTMHTLEEIYNLIKSRVTHAPVNIGMTGAEGLPGYTFVDGEDGNVNIGLPIPTPRFTDNNNGTVTDNLTGLVWLKNASAFLTWTEALTYCNTLAHGTAGLTDGSAPGDWRLPNRFELESLINLAYEQPCISNAVGNAKWTANNPFSNVQSTWYWSGTTCAHDTTRAWGLGLDYGFVNYGEKTYENYVWPVRDSSN